MFGLIQNLRGVGGLVAYDSFLVLSILSSFKNNNNKEIKRSFA